jgi:hypothetical protein
MSLPLREQGVLVVALRGCDSAPKFPLDSPERRMTAAIRYAVCHPADEREVDLVIGGFMTRNIPADVRLAMLEHYPQHWVGHVIHATQVLGYRHPDKGIAAVWLELYTRFCQSLHVVPESLDNMVARLSEDRVNLGKVVSL